MLTALVVLAATVSSSANPNPSASPNPDQWVAVDFRSGATHYGWNVLKGVMRSCDDKKLYNYAPPFDAVQTLATAPCKNPSNTITPGTSFIILSPIVLVPNGHTIDPRSLSPDVLSRNSVLRAYVSAHGTAKFQVIDPKSRKLLTTDEFTNLIKSNATLSTVPGVDSARSNGAPGSSPQ